MNFNLSLLDLIVLYAILNHEERKGVPPKQKELYDPQTGWGLVNEYIEMWSLPRIYNVRRIKGNWPLEDSIALLRQAGLVTEEAPYQATDKAHALFKSLNPLPEDWPIQIPVREGEIILRQAQYVPEELKGKR